MLKAAVPVIGLAGAVLGLIVDGLHLAELHRDGALQRTEGPAEAVGDVGIEADGDLAIGDVLRRGLGALGGAVEAGNLAEHLVERHGREGGADHAGDEDAEDRRR